LSEHGGEGGIRDQDLFVSALHQPRNLADDGQSDAAGTLRKQTAKPIQ